MKRTLRILILLLMCGAPLTAVSQELPTLPPFELSLLSGQPLSDLDLGGNNLLLFAVPDSDACADAFQLLQSALAERPGIAVFVVTPEAGDAANAMLDDVAAPWPVIIDESYLLASVFGVARVPTVCLLVDGKLVGYLERGFTLDELVDALDEPFGNLEALGEQASETEGLSVGFWKLPGPTVLIFAGADCGYCHYMLPSVFDAANTVDTWIVVTDGMENQRHLRAMPNASRSSSIQIGKSLVPSEFGPCPRSS